MVPRSPHDAGRIVVANDYQWIGDPRAVRFTVYVNGRRAGVAPLGEAINAQVDPGTHVLRVRLSWFLSRRVTVSVKPGETVRFSADRPRTLPWWRQLRGLVDPFHWLSLDRTGNT